MVTSSVPSLAPPMPPWAHRFRSDDLDEVREFVTRQSGEHSRVADRSGPLGFDIVWVGSEGAALARAVSSIGLTVRGAVDEPTLHLMPPAGSDYRIGRKQFVAGPADAVFLAPGWEFTRRAGPGVVFALKVNGRLLADEVAARSPERRGVPQFSTRRFELSPTERATLVAAVSAYVPTTTLTTPHPGGPAGQARLVEIVAGLLLQENAVVRLDPVATSRMVDLENWIESQLDQPITMGRLCAVAGVGERRLQKAFLSRRGLSPMGFVTERRLAEAHRRLKAGAALDTVTHVALGLGFRHMGRFALDYRAAFGESPSQTRRQAR